MPIETTDLTTMFAVFLLVSILFAQHKASGVEHVTALLPDIRRIAQRISARPKRRPPPF